MTFISIQESGEIGNGKGLFSDEVRRRKPEQGGSRGLGEVPGVLFLEIGSKSQAPMSTADQLISATVCCPRGLISVLCRRLRGKQALFWS